MLYVDKRTELPVQAPIMLKSYKLTVTRLNGRTFSQVIVAGSHADALEQSERMVVTHPDYLMITLEPFDVAL
jgi:hypothetical protein